MVQAIARSVRYEAKDLPGDLFAGLTLWAVFAAQAIAYSRLSHATPVAGLVTAIAGALLYAILGSSRRISIGPAGGIAAIVGSVTVGLDGNTAASPTTTIAVLTVLSATFLVVAGLLRLSFVSRLFPIPVFVGYLAGIGVSILWGQGKELVSHGSFAFGIGIASMVGVLLLKRIAPRIPGPFVVLLVATIASASLHGSSHGVPVIGKALGQFGSLVSPSAFRWPLVKALIGPALSLALLVYVDAIATADALGKRQDPPLRPIREYFALGVVNLVSGMFGGFMAGCSSSRSIVGIRSGERTKLAGAVAGVLLLLTAFSVVRFLEPMPLAALAGVVFVAALDLVDVKKLLELGRLRRADLVIALVAGAGVLVLGPVGGAGLGVVMALAEAFRRAMAPERGVISRHPSPGRIYEDFSPRTVEPVDGLIVYRFGAPLFFGNADAFASDMRALAEEGPPSLHTVVVNADALGVPDAAARDALVKARDVLAAHGVTFVIGNARRALREALAKVGSFTLIDEAEFVADLKKAHAAP